MVRKTRNGAGGFFSKNGSIGFTLIELLVTVAGFAMLAAMLWPVLSRAEAKDEQMVCMNNLKQIGAAVAMYAQNYEGRLPACGKDYMWGTLLVNAKVLPDNTIIWHGCPTSTSRLGSWASIAYNYSTLGNTADPRSMSNGINGDASLPPVPDGFLKFNQIPFPAGVAMCMDAHNNPQSDHLYENGSIIAWWDDTWIKPGSVRFPIGHNNGQRVNILWCDGHVSSLDAWTLYNNVHAIFYRDSSFGGGVEPIPTTETGG